MKRILFVDDESMVLDGLRRMLRGMRNEWEMEFAASGHEALKILDSKQFDVIVTDMRMPGMDGCQLLNHVKELLSPGSAHCPVGTIRHGYGPEIRWAGAPVSFQTLRRRDPQDYRSPCMFDSGPHGGRSPYKGSLRHRISSQPAGTLF